MKQIRETPFSTKEAINGLSSQYDIAVLSAKKAQYLRDNKVDMFRTVALEEIADGNLDDYSEYFEEKTRKAKLQQEKKYGK